MFIACFSESCCRLWSTYWGGDEDDIAFGISAVRDGSVDKIVVGGQTYSPGAGLMSYPSNNAAGSNYFQPDMAYSLEPDGALLKFQFAPDEKLSIDLASFGASASGRRVTLKWRTASEDHNAGFEIRRAEVKNGGGLEFKAIANHLTNSELIGLGSSPVGKDYRFIDNDPSLTPGRTYVYHLVDIATDGVRTAHSNVALRLDAATVEPIHEFRVDPVQPNPASESVQMKFSLREADAVTVEIYSTDGKRVATAIDNRSFAAGEHVEAISVATLAPGVYTAVVSTGNFSSVRTRQFVVVR
jgi:hypothetical protein